MEVEECIVGRCSEWDPAELNREAMDVSVAVGDERKAGGQRRRKEEASERLTHVSTARISRPIKNCSTHAALLMPSMSILHSSSIASEMFCEGTT